MVDDLQNKVVYSFGVAGDVSFEWDMADRGGEIYMFDPSIDRLPYERSAFHFSPIGIAGQNTEDGRFQTLDSLMRRNNHEKNVEMILKMDVEGAEWSFLENTSIDVLTQFSQMTFEMHDMCDRSNMKYYKKILKKISNDFAPVWLHGNNNGTYMESEDNCLANNMEITFVNRHKYRLFSGDILFPSFLDQENVKYIPEIILGRW